MTSVRKKCIFTFFYLEKFKNEYLFLSSLILAEIEVIFSLLNELL